MRSNGLLKWLVIPIVLATVYGGIHLLSAPRTDADGKGARVQLTPEEMKALGLEGDTPRDTVATLVAQVKQLRSELQSAVSESKQQKAENERLRARENTVDQRIRSALDSERSRMREEQSRISRDREEARGILQELQRKLDTLTGKGAQADLPVGLGLEEGDGKQFGGLRWIEPDDARPTDKKGSGGKDRWSFPTGFGPAQKTLEDATDAAADAGSRGVGASTRPVYTVPSNATLMGSVAMTALIGRVPIDGTVNDPYPFKVLIGPDNLAANGIEIPGVAGAVVSGTASGDWTLSCVRGQIRSVTFVFQDGTIRTIPDDKEGKSQSQGANGASIEGGLGWISDPYGIPCVSGERRSNAQQYLGSQALITAAGAGAASLIDSDSRSVAIVSNGNGSLGTVGISGNEAMGRILAGGVQQMSEWVNKLYGQAFAAVYVQPGAKVAVHLEQPLLIDYDAKGRKVSHRTGEKHATELD